MLNCQHLLATAGDFVNFGSSCILSVSVYSCVYYLCHSLLINVFGFRQSNRTTHMPRYFHKISAIQCLSKEPIHHDGCCLPMQRSAGCPERKCHSCSGNPPARRQHESHRDLSNALGGFHDVQKLQIMKMIKSYYISLTRIICWLVFVLCASIYAMYIVRNSDVTRSGSRSQPAWGQLPTQRMLRGLWLQKHGLVWESCRLTCQLISGRTQISKDLGYLGVKGRGASGIAHSSC